MSCFCQKRKVFIQCLCLEGPIQKLFVVIPKILMIETQWPNKKLCILFLLVLFLCHQSQFPHAEIARCKGCVSPFENGGREQPPLGNSLPVFSHLVETQSEDAISLSVLVNIRLLPPTHRGLALPPHDVCIFGFFPLENRMEERKHFGVLISSGEILMGLGEWNCFQSLKKSSVIWK